MFTFCTLEGLMLISDSCQTKQNIISDGHLWEITESQIFISKGIRSLLTWKAKHLIKSFLCYFKESLTTVIKEKLPFRTFWLHFLSGLIPELPLWPQDQQKLALKHSTERNPTHDKSFERELCIVNKNCVVMKYCRNTWWSAFSSHVVTLTTVAIQMNVNVA